MKEIRFALKMTFPIFFTYLFLGIAFGIMMDNAGYGIVMSALSSLFIYAGSMQIIMVPMIASGASLLSLAFMTLFVNARHIFYGIGFIESFRQMGWRYPYMIFSLTDETYSIFCSVEYRKELEESGAEEKRAAFLVALMNQSYWILGSVLGACAGAFLHFDLTGIDFSATAFFLVVVVSQWKQSASKLPFGIAVASCALFFFCFGADYFLIPSLTACLVLLLVLQKKIEQKEAVSHMDQAA